MQNIHCVVPSFDLFVHDTPSKFNIQIRRVQHIEIDLCPAYKKFVFPTRAWIFPRFSRVPILKIQKKYTHTRSWNIFHLRARICENNTEGKRSDGENARTIRPHNYEIA